MATRVKPKRWRSVGLEAFEESSKIYSPEVLRRILEKAEITDVRQRAQFKETVTNVMAWLYMDLHYENRPRKTEIRAALEEIRRQVVQLRLMFRRLDDDTRRELMGEAHLDPGKPPEFKVAELVGNDPRALTGLNTRLRLALRKYKEADPGAPRKEALERAVFQLVQAWQEIKGEPPTRRFNSPESREYGVFREFVNAALEPLGQQASDDMVKRTISKLKN